MGYPGPDLVRTDDSDAVLQMPIDGMGECERITPIALDEVGFGDADGFAGFDESARPVLQQMNGQTEQFMSAARVQQLGLVDPGRIRGRDPDPFGNPDPQRVREPAVASRRNTSIRIRKETKEYTGP